METTMQYPIYSTAEDRIWNNQVWMYIIVSALTISMSKGHKSPSLLPNNKSYVMASSD